MVTVTLAFAAAPTLTVEVVDTSGTPVPSARVIHRIEHERHRVNAEDGRWTDQVLYYPDGREVGLAPGQRHRFVVVAPGYALAELDASLDRRRSLAQVVLTPSEPVVLAGDPPVAHEAIARWERWREAEHRFVRSGRQGDLAASDRLAWDAREPVREWLDLTDDPRALDLCLQVGSPAYCGL